MGVKTKAANAGVPDWAKDAVWYQIFPERFRNGLSANDPTPETLAEAGVHLPAHWSVCPWDMDWYDRARWELPAADFYKTVYMRRFGGDLIGVREKLDYLQNLGVNAIYLNPVFVAPSLHKYDGACFHHIDPTFGPDRDGDMDMPGRAGETEDPATWVWTAADRYFLDLVRDIHRRGMRVIIDGVFNHTGRNFFAFQDLLKNGRKSRFCDWYRITKWNRDGSFDYKGWFNHKGLPELGRGKDDLADPVREYVFNITRRWMDPHGNGDRSAGVDGWRLDVAFCVPHGFWKKWRAHVKSINPDAFLTAEIVDVATDYLRGDEFDSVMNYMWLFPAVRFFAPSAKPSTATKLIKDLDVLARKYPKDVALVLQNLLDSHDVGRISTILENRLAPEANWDSYFSLSRAQGNPDLNTRRPSKKTLGILRQMVIFQMTYPGAPMIYYGTEAGLWGANDPDNRQPMLWSDIKRRPETHTPRGRCGRLPATPDKRLFKFYQRAIGLRKAHAVLRRGALRWLKTSDERLLAFARSDAQSEIVILLNAGDAPLSWVLKSPAFDLWKSRAVKPGKVGVVPRGWRILSVKACPTALRGR